MKNLLLQVTASALALCCFASFAHADVKCRAEKGALDMAARDYTRVEIQYTRLQQQVDTRAVGIENRRAILEANVSTAQANLKAAETSAIGQGLACLLAPRPNCAGPTTNRVVQQIARAKAVLKAQEGRLAAYNRSSATQMTRLTERVTALETTLQTKKAARDAKESAYTVCMAK